MKKKKNANQRISLWGGSITYAQERFRRYTCVTNIGGPDQVSLIHVVVDFLVRTSLNGVFVCIQLFWTQYSILMTKCCLKLFTPMRMFDFNFFFFFFFNISLTLNFVTKSNMYEGGRTISGLLIPITKTCLYKFDPLKLHFYIVKLGFTGVYIYIGFFLFLLKNIDCGYSLEPPRVFVMSRCSVQERQL